MKKVIIGIDLGGTNFRIGAVTSDNKIFSPSVMKSSAVANAVDPVKKICEMIADYKRTYHFERVEAISIGVPSSVENDKETVICTTNIRNEKGEAVFTHTNIAEGIREYFQVPVFVNNDINNILLYDIAANGLEEKKIVAGIYIGTGVGAAVSIDGKVLEGKNGAQMDLGHIPYYGLDRLCSCGKRGCCESYSSGWKLQEIRKEYYPGTKIQDIFTLHREEEPVKEFVRACANVYALIATIFNPDTLIVGGGVMEMADFPRELFEAEVNAKTGKDVMAYGFDYVYSKDNVGKGVIGAAIFAKNRMESQRRKMAG